MIIDTGASCSLVATRFIEQLGLLDSVNPSKTLIAGLDNKVMPNRGEISTSLSFGGITFEHTYILCNELEQDFLIGMDILMPHRIDIDLLNMRLVTPQGQELFQSQPEMLNRNYKVTCIRTVTIAANSATYIQSRIPIKSNKRFEGIFDPKYSMFRQKGVLLTPALTYTDRNQVFIKCVNPTSVPVTIYRNQYLGRLEPFVRFSNIKGVHRVSESGEPQPHLLKRLPDAEDEETTRLNGKWNNPQDLLDQLKIDDLEIPAEEKQEIKDLILEFQHCFSRNKFDLGRSSFYKAKVDLKRNFTPKWIPVRETPHKMKTHLEEAIHNLEESGQVKRCDYSLWNSAIFLVGKSNGSYRLVQDFRSLNKECLQDNYTIPKINTILDGMSGMEYLSTLDFTSSFNQVGIDEASQPLTAFTHDRKRYMWTTMVQGHKSSSSQFSRCINLLFANMPFKALVCYIDDILVGSSTVKSHIDRLRLIFERLSWGFMKLSPSKTKLIQREVTFLGHKLSKDGIAIDSNKIEAIRRLPAPSSVKKLQTFLGIVNYQRSFIRNFSLLSNPLYNLLKKGVNFEWTTKHQESFDALKDALSSSPILGLADVSDPSQSYEVHVDSSKFGQGATLSQLDATGTRRVISYWSKAVPKHQQKYGATRLEFLALYNSIMSWRIYLQGTRFKVYSDCVALKNLDTIFSKDNAYMQRRLSNLSQFDFEITHISGKSSDIQMADFLSRYGWNKAAYKETASQTTGVWETLDELDTDSPISITASKIRTISATRDLPVSINDIRDGYKTDRVLSEVISWLSNGTKPQKMNFRSTAAELSHYFKKYEMLQLDSGILKIKVFKQGKKITSHLAVVTPSDLIERVMHTYHDNNNHCGTDIGLTQCKRQFYFYKMNKEFELYTAACVTCLRNKRPKKHLRAPLKPIVYSHFGQGIAFDHLEPSKKHTARRNVALFTIVDLFSNFLVCVPVKSTDTDHTIRALMHHWILKHGIPEVVQHDRGSSFTSKLFKEVMKVFGIKDKRSTPYHSQTNGAAEIQNYRINQAMRVSLNDDQWQDYDLWIEYIVFCLNSLVSSKHGQTPNFLTYGRELYMPRDLVMRSDDRIEQMREETSQDERTAIQAYSHYKGVREVMNKVREVSETRSRYAKKQYDKRVAGPYFSEGDYCFILVDVPAHKFADRYRGPYRVVQKINDWNYVVNVADIEKVISISKMRHYYPNKYSPSLESVIEAEEPEIRSLVVHDPSFHPPTSAERQRAVTKSDSSSEDEEFITELLEAHSRAAQRPQSHGLSESTLASQLSFDSTSHISEVAEDTIGNTSGDENRDVEDSDNNEALRDAENERQTIGDNSQPTLSFDPVDSRINLSEFSLSGNPSNRSASTPNLPSTSSKPRYNLRNRGESGNDKPKQKERKSVVSKIKKMLS